jgi:hypothetical protein
VRISKNPAVQANPDIYPQQGLFPVPSVHVFRGPYPPIPNDHTLYSLLSFAVEPDTDPWSTFNICMLYYSRRELTYQKDALNAMTELRCRLSVGMKCPFSEGLQTSILDILILFWAVKDCKRRKGFPSYS